MKAVWRTILEGATDEALLAVDLYNQPRQPRRLEGYFIHMHLAWLYLLHAEFTRDGIDYRYRLSNGHFDKIDGEPKTWELQRCVEQRWPTVGAVRKNLELTIGLRNKIEHRYHEAIALATSGYAQALLLNFEEELTSAFGPSYSLGEQLRFPIFIGSITSIGAARIEELRDNLPANTRDFLATFESGLDPTISNDQKYEFRINLIPKLGSRGSADRALSFIREADLTDEQRTTLQSLGKTGSVVVREQVRPVAGAGMMRPMTVVSEIQRRIQFKFHIYQFTLAWKKLNCRPLDGWDHPERTDERYCIYEEPYKGYLFSPAFVEKIVSEIDTEEKFKSYLGVDPNPK